VTLKGLDTTAALGRGVVHASRRRKLPHLDGLVQTATDQVATVGREGDTVNTILVAIRSLETLHQNTGVDIPDAHTLVERTGSNVARVGRDGNRRDAILDRQGQHRVAAFDIPQTDGAVTTARSDRTTITSEIQTIDVLLVTREGVADRPVGDIPDSDELVLGTSGQVLAVGAEAHAANVEVTADVHVLILQHADLVAGLDVVDLGRSVAARGHVFAVVAEADAADDALVNQRVDELNIQHARNVLVEDGEPVVARLLGVGRKAVRVQVAQSIVDEGAGGARMRRHGASVVGGRLVVHLGRGARAGRVWHRVVDLGSRGAGGGSADAALAVGAGASGALGRLAREAVGARALLVGLLERRLLRRGRRRRWRALEAGRRLRHLVLLRPRALLLRRRLGRQTGLTTLSRHDALKKVVAHADRGRRGDIGRAVLGRAGHARLRCASASSLELAAEQE
jgi:hypothetical protein